MLLDAIKALDDRPGDGNDAVAFDLGRLLTGREPAELTASRLELEGLATPATSRSPGSSATSP